MCNLFTVFLWHFSKAVLLHGTLDLLSPWVGLANIVGMASGLSRRLAGIPIESRKRTPSTTNHSGSKCLEQSTELAKGPSQLPRKRLTAHVHFACTLCLAETREGYKPSPVEVLQLAATQRLGIALLLALYNTRRRFKWSFIVAILATYMRTIVLTCVQMRKFLF